MKVDVSKSASSHSLGNKLARAIWDVVWLVLYRPSPKVCHGWRRFLLRLFRARIGVGVFPHPSARIWAPWNLEIGDHCSLGPHVDCYCVAPIKIGSHVTVSQYTYLCTASHDPEQADMPLVTAPITIGDGAWIAADVFVGPGVRIGEGAVAGVRSTVLKDVPPWSIVGGTPAREIRKRVLRDKQGDAI